MGRSLTDRGYKLLRKPVSNAAWQVCAEREDIIKDIANINSEEG